MAIRIVHKGPSYNFTVTTPAIHPGKTEREEVDRIKSEVIPRTFPDVAEIHEADQSEIPADHTCNLLCEFRPAFEWRDDAVRVNMAGARVIHMNTIRAARDAELAKEDINMLRAIEAGDTSAQSAVAAKKQVLRDIPATFSLDGYADPVALKAAWPSELPARE
jgi:hypothetical protein